MTSYALIDPNIFYENDQNKLAVHYIEHDRGTFEVCPPFYWLECSNNLETGWCYYDLITEQFVVIPKPKLNLNSASI